MSIPEIILLVSAGTATLLSPCGYALIPAYMGYSVARGVGLGVALMRSAIASAGIVAVYTLMAGLIFLARETVRAYIPHLSLLAGAIILVMGLAKFLSINLPAITPMKTLIPLGETSFLLFGVGYGLGASGCNLPIFISVLTYATLASGAWPITIMLSYAAGVVTPLIILGTLASILGFKIMKRVGVVAHYASRVSAIVLMVAGIYIIYFYYTAYVVSA
ncbi:MAG: cytochrome c biogenesis protein CcdA [Nitrososphaerota archaeon]